MVIVKAPGFQREMNDWVKIQTAGIAFEHHSQIRRRKLIFLVGCGFLLGCEMKSVRKEIIPGMCFAKIVEFHACPPLTGLSYSPWIITQSEKKCRKSTASCGLLLSPCRPQVLTFESQTNKMSCTYMCRKYLIRYFLFFSDHF